MVLTPGTGLKGIGDGKLKERQAQRLALRRITSSFSTVSIMCGQFTADSLSYVYSTTDIVF